MILVRAGPIYVVSPITGGNLTQFRDFYAKNWINLYIVKLGQFIVRTVDIKLRNVSYEGKVLVKVISKPK